MDGSRSKNPLSGFTRATVSFKVSRQFSDTDVDETAPLQGYVVSVLGEMKQGPRWWGLLDVAVEDRLQLALN